MGSSLFIDTIGRGEEEEGKAAHPQREILSGRGNEGN